MIGAGKAKQALGAMSSTLGVPGPRTGEVLVLNMHRLSTGDIAKFVDRHSDRFDFATSNDLRTFGDPSSPTHRPMIVLTFDDGFSCHYPVAEYLASRGIGAIFFVVPEFSSSSTPADFAAAHIIRPTVAWSESDLAELTPLSRAQILEMARMGHLIGSHTMSHNLYPGMPRTSLRREIVDSRSWIEEVIQRPVRTFAGPFSTDLLDDAALMMVSETYEFNFLTYPARATNFPSGLVWRTNVEARWPVAQQEYGLRCLELDSRRYAKRRGRIESRWALLAAHKVAR